LFGLIICAVLIAVITQHYNEDLCVLVSDLVKINSGKKEWDVNPRGYVGGHTSENDVRSPHARWYNKEFIRDHKEHNPSFSNMNVNQMEKIRFPPDRTF
jgi:hypothetical protein